MTAPLHDTPRISYYYDELVSQFHFGDGHPMKPYRLALTNELVREYGLLSNMSVCSARFATEAELAMYHAPEYIDFLRRLSPERAGALAASEHILFNPGADCPAWEGILPFCKRYTGASLDGARRLVGGVADVAINWAGGLHHAKRAEASGFCYVNDIVVAALELLRHLPRILYIDIDVHHGDGVQDAFYASDRVMTLSFHQYGDGFFPGTGSSSEIGAHRGKYYAVNVPLKRGIDDAGYAYVFKPVVDAAIYYFRPSAIVLQCGADSLGCDRLGAFNLTVRGHGECIAHVRSHRIPTLVLGGGGYTIRNVSRCWAYETSMLCETSISNTLPDSIVHRDFFGPDFKLHPDTQTRIENQNTRAYLDDVRATALEHLRRLQGAPSVQMHIVPHPDDFIDGVDELFTSDTEDENDGPEIDVTGRSSSSSLSINSLK